MVDIAEDRFSAELISDLGASVADLGRRTIHSTRNLGADVLTIMRDILRVDQAGDLDTETLSDEDFKTLQLIRSLEDSPQLREPSVTRPRKPIRFSEAEQEEETGLDLLLEEEARLQDSVPNLANRGRFGGSGRRLPKELGGPLVGEESDFPRSGRQRPRDGRQTLLDIANRARDRDRDRDR